jgi:hypothetical protein
MGCSDVGRILGQVGMGGEWLDVFDRERTWIVGVKGVVDGLAAVTAGSPLSLEIGRQQAVAPTGTRVCHQPNRSCWAYSTALLFLMLQSRCANWTLVLVSSPPLDSGTMWSMDADLRFGRRSDMSTLRRHSPHR